MRFIALLLVVVVSSGSAVAQPAGAQAEALFRQGRELLAAGKTTEACSAFAESQRLDPVVTTLLNLAACREKAGQLATAWGLFLDAERQTRSARDDAAKKLHEVALEKAKKLEPRVSKLTINVSDQSRLDQLEITRDGESITSVMWNRALPIDGGTYTITARAPGTSEWKTQVTIATELDSKTVEIPDLRTLPRDLRPAPAAAATVPPVDPFGVPPEEPHAGRSKLGPVLVGAGALVFLGGALGFHLWGNATYDDAKAEQADQARRDELYDSANTKRHVAQGLLGAGAVTAGIAVWLLVRGGDETPKRTATRRIGVTPTGLVVMGQF